MSTKDTTKTPPATGQAQTATAATTTDETKTATQPAANADQSNAQAPAGGDSGSTQPTKTKATAAKKSAKKTLDVEKLKDLSDQISGHGRGADMTDLIARLKSEEDLSLKETKKDSGIYVAKMAGVKTKPVKTERTALQNWANKARREILNAA